MKATQFSIFYLLILFASALTHVFGTPILSCNGRMCADIVARDDTIFAELKESANKTIKYIKEHVDEINKTPICFYSGFTTIDSQKVNAWQKISDFNKEHRVHILNDIIADAHQNSTGWEDEDWTAVSKTLARNARSPVFVVLGQFISAESVYLNTEYPTLIKSDSVKKPLSVYEINDNGGFDPVKTK